MDTVRGRGPVCEGHYSQDFDLRHADRTFAAAAAMVLSSPNQNEIECYPYDLDVLYKENDSARDENEETIVMAAPPQL